MQIDSGQVTLHCHSASLAEGCPRARAGAGIQYENRLSHSTTLAEGRSFQLLQLA